MDKINALTLLENVYTKSILIIKGKDERKKKFQQVKTKKKKRMTRNLIIISFRILLNV